MTRLKEENRRLKTAREPYQNQNFNPAGINLRTTCGQAISNKSMKVGHTSRACPLLNQPVLQPPRFQQQRYSPPFRNQYSRFLDNRYRSNNDNSYNSRPSYQQYSRDNYYLNNNNNYNSGYNDQRNDYSRGNTNDYNINNGNSYQNGSYRNGSYQNQQNSNEGGNRGYQYRNQSQPAPYLARKRNNHPNDKVGIVEEINSIAHAPSIIMGYVNGKQTEILVDSGIKIEDLDPDRSISLKIFKIALIGKQPALLRIDKIITLFNSKKKLYITSTHSPYPHAVGLIVDIRLNT